MFQAVKASRGVANPNIGFICQARLVGLLGWGCWGAGRLQAVGGPARCLLWKFASARLINIMPPSCPPSVQLLQWHKRRHAPVDSCRLWRVAPQSAAAPQYLVAKAVAAPRPSSLDPRGAFVLQGPASTAVWLGAACPEPFAAAAHRFAQQLQRYEGAPGPALVVRQGQESEVFWTSLAAATAEGSGSRAGSPAAPGSAAAAGAAAAAAELVAAAAAGPVAVAENSAYDKDFEVRSLGSSRLLFAAAAVLQWLTHVLRFQKDDPLHAPSAPTSTLLLLLLLRLKSVHALRPALQLYARSLTARTSGDGGDSARSGGRKTPREEGGEPGALSPNDRLRKQVRGCLAQQ